MFLVAAVDIEAGGLHESWLLVCLLGHFGSEDLIGEFKYNVRIHFKHADLMEDMCGGDGNLEFACDCC